MLFIENKENDNVCIEIDCLFNFICLLVLYDVGFNYNLLFYEIKII